MSDGQAPVITVLPKTADEIAEEGTTLSEMNHPATGVKTFAPGEVAAAYAVLLDADNNVNYRTEGGPFSGHLPAVVETAENVPLPQEKA